MKRIFIVLVSAKALLLPALAWAQLPTEQIQADLTQLKADEAVFQNAVGAIDPQSAQDQAALRADAAAMKACVSAGTSCAAVEAQAKAHEAALKADWAGAKAACAAAASCAAAQASFEGDRKQLQADMGGLDLESVLAAAKAQLPQGAPALKAAVENLRANGK